LHGGDGRPTRTARPLQRTGLQFCDYIRLLAYCGAREQEALRLRWPDVDFQWRATDHRQRRRHQEQNRPQGGLQPHTQGALARDAQAPCAPDSEWLFPSHRSGAIKDIHAQTFRESLKLVRAHAAKKDPHLASKAFHDLRHCFASYCVMAGIDFKTVSEWLGHRDGGVLVCQVYAHLTDDHKKEQAKRLNFEAAVKEQAA
jgi:integrase